jgi:hypothetical protein
MEVDWRRGGRGISATNCGTAQHSTAQHSTAQGRGQGEDYLRALVPSVSRGQQPLTGNKLRQLASCPAAWPSP